MKNKERPRVLTKEDLIYEVKKDHEGPKSHKEGKKKEIIIIIKRRKGYAARISIRPEDMQQRSQSDQRICSKKNQHQGPRTLMCPFVALRRVPWLAHGKAKVYV